MSKQQVVAVSGDASTAGAFIDAVWHFEGRPLPLFHDPELGFYKALGLRPAETWRIFRCVSSSYRARAVSVSLAPQSSP